MRRMSTDGQMPALAPDRGPLDAVSAGTVDDAFIDLEARLRDAQLGADVAALDQLIHDELLFTGPDGELATKAQDLAAHASGIVRFVTHEPRELRMRRVSDDVVVTALRARVVVNVAGSRNDGVARYTRVWARGDDGQWCVVAGHVSVT